MNIITCQCEKPDGTVCGSTNVYMNGQDLVCTDKDWLTEVGLQYDAEFYCTFWCRDCDDGFSTMLQIVVSNE